MTSGGSDNPVPTLFSAVASYAEAQLRIDPTLTVPRMHMCLLEHFAYAPVVFPLNHRQMLEHQHAAGTRVLVYVCRERGVAMQTIKGLCRWLWGDRERNRATWFEPIEEPRAIDAAVIYVLGHPQVFLNTPGMIHLPSKVMKAANRFEQASVRQQMVESVAASDMVLLWE